MEKTPYNLNIDKLAWMRANMCYNIAITTPDFSEGELPSRFAGEPVWIVAEHVGLHFLFDVLGLGTVKLNYEDDIPYGFTALIVRYGSLLVEFNLLKPKKDLAKEFLDHFEEMMEASHDVSGENHTVSAPES